MDCNLKGSSAILISWNLIKIMSIELVMLLTISSSAAHFSFCFQSFPASGSFPKGQFFLSGGQSIGASASVLPKNSRVSFLSDWLVLFPCRWQHSQVFSSTTIWKYQFFSAQPFYGPTLTSVPTTGKIIVLTLSAKLCLCFLMNCRFVIAFLARSRCLLISWLESQSTVVGEPEKIKFFTAFNFSP